MGQLPDQRLETFREHCDLSELGLDQRMLAGARLHEVLLTMALYTSLKETESEITARRVAWRALGSN
jgi:hypothetical protein